MKAGLLESPNLQIRSTVEEWLHLTPCTCKAILYSSMKDGGLAITKLMELNPSIQAQRLRRLAQCSDDALRTFLKEEWLDQVYKKLRIRAGEYKEKIMSIWEPKPKPDCVSKHKTSDWEVAIPKIQCPRPCNWRKEEFNKWKQLVSQGCAITNFEDNISNFCVSRYRGTPHRKLITVLQLRANVYTTREFLARGKTRSMRQKLQTLQG